MTPKDFKETLKAEYISHQDTKKKIVQKPRYIHDCFECKFFGCWKQYDLWACVRERPWPQPTLIKSIIARYGEDGNYYSGNVFALANKPLGICFQRVYNHYNGRVDFEFLTKEYLMRMVAGAYNDTERKKGEKRDA